MRRTSPRLARALAPLALLVPTIPAVAQLPDQGALGALVTARESRLAHYSSFDPRERNDDFRPLAPGETVTLVDHRGAGIVRRWWVTIAPRNSVPLQRQLIVRCWWDGEETPSVEVPLSDFFGLGFGEWRDLVSVPLNMTSGGYNTYWAMPFRRRARITIENRSSLPVDRLYFNVDIETFDSLPDDVLYFHAQFRRTTAVRGAPVTDYGRVRLHVNGRALAPVVDMYAAAVEPTAPVSFGRVPLRAGANELVVELVGKDPRSQGFGGGYLVGIDGFFLRR